MLSDKDRIEQLERENAEMREALKLFAQVADVEDEVGRDDPDDDRIWIVQAYGCHLADLTVEDFRRARRLAEQEGT